MAAASLPTPGTSKGPCSSRFCIHTDCKATRKQADMPCQHCGKVIGYETPFYQVNGHERYVHAKCEEALLARRS